MGAAPWAEGGESADSGADGAGGADGAEGIEAEGLDGVGRGSGALANRVTLGVVTRYGSARRRPGRLAARRNGAGRREPAAPRVFRA